MKDIRAVGTMTMAIGVLRDSRYSQFLWNKRLISHIVATKRLSPRSSAFELLLRMKLSIGHDDCSDIAILTCSVLMPGYNF